MNTIGERIYHCRKLLNISRHKLVSEYSAITVSTLERWENNKVHIKEKNILSFVHFLNERGIPATIEWLRYGAGNLPMLDSQSASLVGFDAIAKFSAEQIKNNLANFIYFKIANNSFAPALRYGDYAGGIVDNRLYSLDGKLCFYKNNSNIIIGLLNYIDENSFSLKDNQNDIKKLKLDEDVVLGEVSWIMRRFD